MFEKFKKTSKINDSSEKHGKGKGYFKPVNSAMKGQNGKSYAELSGILAD